MRHLVVDLASQFCPVPKLIMERRLIKKDYKAVVQCLVKWAGLDASYATWELVYALKARFPSFTPEDKGVVQPGRY